VSAADKEVDDLTRAGQAIADTRRVVVGNTLVLIVPAGATGGPKSFADLLTDPGKVAAGDPESVPAGHYAQQTLAALKLTDAVTPRLVYGQNVRQVLTYVERGEVSAGLVYGTDARQAGPAVRVVAVADPGTHDPIEYPAVVIAGSPHAAAARRFLEYLGTPAARTVLVDHGFTVPAVGERSTYNAQLPKEPARPPRL
jgi:molybdate transport system substrate-binding protein